MLGAGASRAQMWPGCHGFFFCKQGDHAPARGHERGWKGAKHVEQALAPGDMHEGHCHCPTKELEGLASGAEGQEGAADAQRGERADTCDGGERTRTCPGGGGPPTSCLPPLIPMRQLAPPCSPQSAAIPASRGRQAGLTATGQIQPGAGPSSALPRSL